MPMNLIWIVMLATLLAGIILFLHRSQQQNRRKVIDRSAPLALPEIELQRPAASRQVTAALPLAEPAPATSDKPVTVTDIPAITDSVTSGNWLNHVKRLREKGDTEGALQLCQEHFPRLQAFQQAALILRQQVRELVEQHRPANTELKQLYRIAVLADLFRSSNPHKPRDAQAAFAYLASCDFDYQRHGTRQLRLLTKSDIRHFEQLWGRPQSHLHAEEVLGEQWQQQCA